MISLDDARSRILEALHPLEPESIPLERACHRVVALPVEARFDVPPFDNASVDGYAVRSVDLSSTASAPANPLPVHTTVSAGDRVLAEFPPRTCIRIFTGAALPRQADAVVMQEDVTVDAAGRVGFREAVTPWEGIRFAGEDVRRGSVLAPVGQRLRPAHSGLLAAAGVDAVSVHRLPRVSLLTSGNELVDPAPDLASGKIPDSNRFMLAALARSAGVIVTESGRLPDALEPTMEGLRQAAGSSDVVVTTGGVSVGDADCLKAAFERLGGQLELWRIALKPGKPFAWGRLGRVHWFGLPGNPVSAFVTWQLLVLPALRKLEGDRDVSGRRVMARLVEPVRNRGDRLQAFRVHLDQDGSVRLAGTQASHIQSGLAAASALLSVPPETTWDPGTEVVVELLD